MGIRNTIAGVLEAELTQPIAVYDSPVEVSMIPAVVVAPDGGDYIVPISFGRDGRAEAVRVTFRIQILESRAIPEVALDRLEARRREVTDALRGIPGAQWSGFVDVGEATVADVKCVGGTVIVTIRMGDDGV
ncbi:MAG: hypothetical protein DRH08_11615 [Deltaproteobacteria bacterium]|nr:MAG: hypothetical protein DRH08_11615 [Deltaproteobacteria bacterium]